jgi:diguanylate cyclase (GGDEF)-like protein/PAS domain S-box-containing protein
VAAALRGGPAGLVWAAYLLGGTVLATAYLLLADRPPMRLDPIADAFGLASVAAIVLATKKHWRTGRPWGYVARGLAAFVVADMLAYNYKALFGHALPFPSPADAIRVIGYLFLAAGIVLLVHRHERAPDRAALIDSLIVATSGGVLSWALLIAPYVHDSSLPLINRVVRVAYPVLDLVVVAAIARFAFDQGRHALSAWLATAATILLVVTDSAYQWGLRHGGFGGSRLLEGGHIAFFVVLGAAALHRSSDEPVLSLPEGQFRLTTVRLWSMAACAIVTPGVLAFEGWQSKLRDVPLLASCSGIVFLMAFLRLLDLGRRHRAGLQRATVLAGAGVSLVDARTRAEVREIASTAGATITGGGTVSIVRAEGSGVKADRFAHAFELHGRRHVHGELRATTEAPIDADMHESLSTLANGVALALDGIEMAEELSRKRAEVRFQALVQYSSDAIIVIDHAGRVDYASPSTTHVIGEDPDDLRGKPFLDLVAEHDQGRFSQALGATRDSESTAALEFELASSRGRLDVEAVCTNLIDNEDVRGVVVNIRDIAERKGFERQLAHQAFHDEITGLANRALFRDRVTHSLERVSRGVVAGMAVLFLDIDDFKVVNDTLGHQVGDLLIREVGARIAESTREVDTAARLGGDEFAVLVESGEGRFDPSQLADRLLATIAEPIEVDGNNLLVTGSIGIAQTIRGKSITVDELLRNADVAMYSAKGDGKGVRRTFEPEMQVALLGKLELKGELQRGIDRGEFELAYQPIIDLETERTVLLEALVRWQHPTKGFVSPADFVSLAEETGAIVALGEHILRMACTQGVRLVQLLGDQAPGVTVNISGRQLQEPKLVRRVMKVLAETGLPPEQLVVEITESVMISDVDVVLNRLGQLKSCGVRLAVDDFGSGYSSLNYVRRFPIDILKIDRTFIADLTKSEEVSSLTRTILDLAKILDVVPVAEGIEDPEQLAALRQLGCALGQGYLFMPPLSVPDVEQHLLGLQSMTA